MSPLLRLTATETRLFLREPIVVFFALAFAPVLLVVLGLIPSMREDSAELGGVRPITLYLPIVVSMGIALFALSGLSQLFASYREKGVLRRLRTTPVAPGVMLGAQLLMATALSLVTLLVMLTIGRLAFDVDLPRNLAAFLLGYLLMASAMFAVGLLVAALAPTGRSAGAMGSLAFFPLVFFAGLMALSACLVAVAPWYGFFNFVGYPLAFRYLRGRRRYVGAAVTAMISAAGFMGGVAGINAAHVWWAWLAVGLISAVLAGALFHFVEMDDHRNTKQKRACPNSTGPTPSWRLLWRRTPVCAPG